MKQVFIPRTIDASQIVLLWTLEEVLLITTFVCLGMLIKQALILFFISLFFVKRYRKFESQHPDGYLVHLLYWNGFMLQGRHATFPPTYIKEWIE